MITDSTSLADACTRLAQERFITVDTEFLRENTFWPKLCVVQLAGEHDAFAVDALAPGLDMSPLFALMADPAVLKVFHSGRQDIEIFWHLGQLIPAPLFDTQIAASVLGYGDSVAYDQLVQQITGRQIDKSSRFTDWSRRPLSDAQIDYAIADVTHLRDVYMHLSSQLEERGRSAWIGDDMRILTAVETYEQPPELAWKRLKARIKKPRELATLIEVAAWREREAQSRDLPRGRVLKDEQVIDIASRQPKTTEALGQLRGIPNGFEKSRHGAEVLSAIKKAQSCSLDGLPALERGRAPSNGSAAIIELLRVLLKLVAEREEVSPRILASQDDLEHIASGGEDGIAALTGWRMDLFGKHALELTQGRTAIALSKGKLMLIPTVI
jgi:ribonuclease D